MDKTRNIPLDALSLLEQIAKAPVNPDSPRGGVDIRYEGNQISGSFIFPVEVIPHGAGRLMQVIDFLPKE